MAKKDLASKKIEEYNEVFADIYNTLLFGKDLLSPDGLRAGATESIYKTDGREVNDQRRDVLKKYHGGASLLISSLGIENQASVDELMPLRVMGYDFGTYRQQVIEGEKKITPVITIVSFTQDSRYLDGVRNLNGRKEKGGAVTMCEVAEALISQGRLEGILEGKREGRLEGKREGILEGKVELLFEMDFAISDISKKLNVSEETVREILKRN